MKEKINETLEKSPFAFSILRASNQELANRSYKNNLSIIQNERKESFIDTSKQEITLKIPVFTNNFRNYGIYDISNTEKKAILYLLSDNNEQHTLKLNMNNLITHSFNFSEIKSLDSNSTFSINKNQELFVITFNDDLALTEEAYLKTIAKQFKDKFKNEGKINCGRVDIYTSKPSIKEPKEACGGIIID